MFFFDVLSIGNKQRNTSQSLLRCDLFAHLLFDLEGYDDDEYEDSMSFVLIGEALTVSFCTELLLDSHLRIFGAD